MLCNDPRCTGSHDDRKWDILCPRSRENKLATDRKHYAAMTWREHYARQLKNRRLRALQRMERRQRGAVSEQG